MNTSKSYQLILSSGVILQSICILATSIYGLGEINDAQWFLFRLILIPNIISYILIVIGLLYICINGRCEKADKPST